MYCPTSFLDSLFLHVDRSFCRKVSYLRVFTFQGTLVAPALTLFRGHQLLSLTIDLY